MAQRINISGRIVTIPDHASVKAAQLPLIIKQDDRSTIVINNPPSDDANFVDLPSGKEIVDWVIDKLKPIMSPTVPPSPGGGGNQGGEGDDIIINCDDCTIHITKTPLIT